MRPLLLLAALALPAAGETAVPLHGNPLVGDLRVEGEELVQTRESSDNERRYPLADYLLVEKEDGSLVWAPGFEERLRGYRYLALARKRDLLAGLADDARKAKDRDLARRVFEAAEDCGYTGKDAEKLKKKIDGISGSSKVNRKKADAVLAKLRVVPAIEADLLATRAARETNDAPVRLRLLRAALRADPKCAPARELLAQLAPKDFPLGDAALWLDYQIDLFAHGAALAPDEVRELLRFRAVWRKDLYGVVSEPVYLFTPVKDSRTVGRCLAYGKLTCEALGQLFATDKPMLHSSKGLSILLYANKEEYKTKRGTGGVVASPEALDWSLGHYDPMDMVSRIYWDTDRDAERRIARTFVHELTHHWLMQWNPRYGDGQVRRSPRIPGFWIVEGFASLMEEGSFDVDSMTWTLFDARNPSLDTVHALSGTGKLLPWKLVFSGAQIHFVALSKDPTVRFVRRWAMGERVRSQALLFYDQAAAACNFLYHDGPESRKKLIRYVVDYYTGQRARLSIDAAFGMNGAMLGRKVEAYARRVAEGWRPK